MCEFFSCIVTKAGEVIWEVGLNNHEDLIVKAKLHDDTDDKNKLQFARVEIVPPGNNVFEKDLSKWRLKIDERIKPTWWNIEMETKCFMELGKCLSEIIIDNQEIKEIKDKKGLYIKDSVIESVGGSAVISHLYSKDAKYKIEQNNKGLVIIRYKDNIEIVHARGTKIILNDQF